ncbi:hypothetical protein OS493_025004 [Desmophyllum pertusum]|uniref:Uncharacterized protein n=1 Tax=Desmophyllum pertusum TaxID=174260 RepID=A0A9W9YMZ7_9CNID|nr:hypothetical protein OS493_025004 [Desmophyllum pertusum]
MHTIAECYDVIFPWLNLLKDAQEIENSVAKDLPKSLKLWLQPLQVAPSDKMSNSTSLTPSAKTLTPGTLDKLFASTPREKPQDPSPRLLPTITDSLTEPSCDLGESFLSEESHRPLKDSDALITDENSILKTKLFAESPAELHKSDEEKTRITDNDSTRGKKRRAEVIDSDKDAKRTKKDKVKDKASGKDAKRSRRTK